MCAACTALTSLEALSGGDGDGDAQAADVRTSADGPSVEASGEADASDGAVTSDADAALAELHPNGTFESGGAPWGSYNGNVFVLDGTARTGSRSLRACGQATAPADPIFSGDDNGAAGAPIVGATYRATAWVRTAPGSAVPPGVSMRFRTIQLPVFVETEIRETAGVAITSTWQKLDIELPVSKSAAKLNIAVLGKWAAGACFLIDDVSIVRIQ
jgi:hypothetical protein